MSTIEKRTILFSGIMEILSDGLKLMLKLPSTPHPDAEFFNVIGHYLARISCMVVGLMSA